MSALPPVEGHEAERAGLAAAAESGQLPHSILLHGPAGIGKQRVALWLGQLLLCQRFPTAAPCGDCQPCRLAGRLQHPDLHWFFPLPRPKGASDRLSEALEEARAAELEIRREQPLRPSLPIGLAGIYLAQVQSLIRRAAARPSMGRRKVFIIGDAELLVPQEASPEAANALLKLLEEPPADTTIIVTATDPDLLLPTIRSRLLPVRLRPLPVAEAARFLEQRAGVPAEHAGWAAQLAGGSIGRALGFLPQGDQPGPLAEIRQQGRALLEAAQARPGAAAVAAGHAE
ncbi:MAG: AAA family ATPase, partial [Gemmatimonadetes bacterium]|nr:AAA family ATPase [Gemmatimonadota bacterium]